ncbi:ribbon-helix-helix protein, CopG family [Acinetobacter baumannii]|uniref:ribbon-helix-helix protein, CopG family n=1 Tax=Acinetobacter calcoaceticus/baumannii complex TaxID=909768 RepID=UPI00124FD124|nr:MULTISPECIES: ribbon-helix-helix protein, CopG family [Acinetobacter calcoaceticus/baumannii complex]MDI9725442.1 ribbon-helix-helix protein, CopG family [Acinetobacter baumannii]
MSTETSPSNRSRSKKISGGRIPCIVYLPKEEVKAIDKEVEETDSSRSSVIARIYYLGKKQTPNNEDQNQ